MPHIQPSYIADAIPVQVHHVEPSMVVDGERRPSVDSSVADLAANTIVSPDGQNMQERLQTGENSSGTNTEDEARFGNTLPCVWPCVLAKKCLKCINKTHNILLRLHRKHFFMHVFDVSGMNVLRYW